jgi:hypothetical protein
MNISGFWPEFSKQISKVDQRIKITIYLFINVFMSFTFFRFWMNFYKLPEKIPLFTRQLIHAILATAIFPGNFIWFTFGRGHIESFWLMFLIIIGVNAIAFTAIFFYWKEP